MKNRPLSLVALAFHIQMVVMILVKKPVAASGFAIASGVYWVAYYLSGR